MGKWTHGEPFAAISLPVAKAAAAAAAVQKGCIRYRSIIDDHRQYLLLKVQWSDGREAVKLVKAFVDSSMDGKTHEAALDAAIAADASKNKSGSERWELFCNRQLLATLGDASKIVGAQLLKVLTESQLTHWKRVVLTPMRSGGEGTLNATYVSACLRGTIVESESNVMLPSIVHSVMHRSGGGGGMPDPHEFVAFQVSAATAPAGVPRGMRFGIVGPQTEIHVEQYHESDTHRRTAQRDAIMDLIMSQDQTASVMKFVQLALGLGNESKLGHIRRQRAVSLVLYGPRGVGKRSMMECIATKLGVELFRITAADVYSEQYAYEEGGDSGSITGLTSILKRAARRQPSMLLINDIDALFPRDEDAKDLHLISELSKLLEQLHANHDGRYSQVSLVAITSQIESLDPFIRKRFQEEIFIDVPSVEERRVIIRRFARKMESCSSISDSELDKLSDNCHGYVQADIHAMFRYAALRAMSRPSCKLTIEDFEAHKTVYGYQPYSIREAAVAITVPQIPRVAWTDIGGLSDIKSQLHEMIVWPLKHADSFDRMGIKPPSGILLYGPPGTGKTLLAKAVASASSANFISVNIPDLIKAEIGESEKTLAEMFRRAKLAAPSVIFFDEIQAMFGDRDNVSRDQQKLVSQLLLEMDALADESDSVSVANILDSAESTPSGQRRRRNVVVIAATNVPQNIDSSLMRPGRFERVLFVGPPDADARLSILEMVLKDMKVSAEVRSSEKMKYIVKRTEGFTGAELVNLCHQAGLYALCTDMDATEITMQDFETALRNARPSPANTMRPLQSPLS